MMDLLIWCYKTFTIRWRIRVNLSKCKVAYSEKTLHTYAHYFGDNETSRVQSLKYLRYWIGRVGRAENDKHVVAQAAHLRFKVRVVLPILGEMLTLVLVSVNTADESWPVDSLAVWAPDGGGQQAELQDDTVSPDGQQTAAA